jgi:hypothetical protein
MGVEKGAKKGVKKRVEKGVEKGVPGGGVLALGWLVAGWTIRLSAGGR